MPRFNPLVARMAPPPIPAVQDWARAYDRHLGPEIDLSQAVPGYPPHPDLLRWLGEAAARASTAAYGPIEGDQALREAFATYQNVLYGSRLGPANVLITAGCNQAFMVAALAVAEPGSRVLLTNPFYFNHETALRMYGVGIRLVDCLEADGFLPDLSTVADAIGPDVRALALVSPNNPAGAIYPLELLAALYEVCRARGIFMILDETYRDFLPPERRRPHTLFDRPGWDETLISLYSFSKGFCIPGHRLGAVIGSPALVGELVKIMDGLQICAPRTGQIALAEALPALADWQEANRVEVNARAARLMSVMAGCPGWEVSAIGAYFAYVRHPFRHERSASVAERLAHDVGVVAVPGSYFGPGQDEFLRFAFANADMPTLDGLAPRLAACGERLSNAAPV
jgi:hypothetical protein